MYDSLALWYRGANCLTIAPLLSRLTEHQTEHSYYVTGGLKNLNITQSEQGISIKGSLCKWYLGDNLQTLTMGDTKLAIEALSETFNIAIVEAKVKRIDVAQNLIMKHNPTIYFPYLGDCQHFDRIKRNTSLYYQNGNRIKVFYDKIAECKSNGAEVHKVFQNQNLLRFELRYLQRLDRAFNVAEINAKMLYKEQFYINILDRWVDEYRNINKLTKMVFKDNTQLKPKDFIDQLLLQSILNMGGQSTILEMVDEARKKGQFERPEYASRAKSMIKEICRLESITEPSELVQELDRKIKQVQLYYR